MFSSGMAPCVIFEDEHLLVVSKPAGWNTHAPGPYAGEGIYDWLKHREPCWSSLAILHRLDKETSGVLVFGKTTLANKSLTEQFTERRVRKKYLLLTDKLPPEDKFSVKSKIARVGERYASSEQGEIAETRFSMAYPRSIYQDPKYSLPVVILAEPLTGRTHQIRVHAAENGFPILGDALYGGSTYYLGRPFRRVCLTAQEISFIHPKSGQTVRFSAVDSYADDPQIPLREKLINTQETNSFRWIHGASDGWPGWHVDRLGDFLLSQSEAPLSQQQRDHLQLLANPNRVMQTRWCIKARGTYHKILSRQVRRSTTTEASPQLIFGEAAPERFEILENGVRYELSFNEGYSTGLFLDQRDNRRRFLTGHIAADFPLLKSQTPDAGSEIRNSKFEILNTFAYTCGFSVCAAKAGARVTSLDLSKKYLEWGKRNFTLNGLDPAAHDFIFGDTFDWLRRLAKKGRTFDAVVLDPPTFSQSKEHGAFRAEKDYGRLVAAALPLVKPGGILFASTNAADWPPENFLADVTAAVRAAKRKILRQHYVPQPPDFPISRAEPAYLKTVWLRIG
jgi:23S rRNA (cytosine1962-C5)-methyltransferase